MSSSSLQESLRGTWKLKGFLSPGDDHIEEFIEQELTYMGLLTFTHNDRLVVLMAKYKNSRQDFRIIITGSGKTIHTGKNSAHVLWDQTWIGRYRFSFIEFSGDKLIISLISADEMRPNLDALLSVWSKSPTTI
ncbi:hypothetical protein [Aurantimicrobium minutum]|uniref:hypothetical protein n=1 Tax=Aurantimicrobium minutum TaxID=708131 RepID=UPI0024751F28|nr:hypothetical protein [Aurantimicrobium minutum]MDH6422276.1 hypothetical protein [Aurantimicrobium minutum]